MDGREYAPLDSAGRIRNTLTGGRNEEHPTLKVAGLAYYGCHHDAHLSVCVCFSSLVAQYSNVTAF